MYGGNLQDVGAIETGTYQLEARDSCAGPMSAAAVGFPSLTAGSEEALDDLGRGRTGGLLRAREIMGALGRQPVVGRELFLPIDELKGHDGYPREPDTGPPHPLSMVVSVAHIF
ncbi:MAG TPA: hypothetical protein VK997_09740, partial [Deferrisomatales bacterium]|nr:hypothetical protein [Deferrisomatales bacterium]